jgi:hypothetical protein
MKVAITEKAMPGRMPNLKLKAFETNGIHW